MTHEVKMPRQVMKMVEAEKPAVAEPVADAPVPGTAAPAQAAAVIEQPAVKPEAQPKDGSKNYEQLYRTLKGKYDTEVPAMQRRIRDLEGELEARPHRADGSRANLMDAVPEEMRGEADEETLKAAELMIQQARAEASDEIRLLSRKNFLLELGRLCPEVETINHNPAFIAWADEAAPMTGTTRRALLDAANRANDAVRAAEIFNAWVKEQGGHVPRKPEEVAVPAPSLGGHVPGEKKAVFTTTQVREFYERVMKGRFRDDPEGFASLDKAIKAAEREGRVIEG